MNKTKAEVLVEVNGRIVKMMRTNEKPDDRTSEAARLLHFDK